MRILDLFLMAGLGVQIAIPVAAGQAQDSAPFSSFGFSQTARGKQSTCEQACKDSAFLPRESDENRDPSLIDFDHRSSLQPTAPC